MTEKLHWEKYDTEKVSISGIQIVDRLIYPTKARIDAMMKSLSGPLGQIDPILIAKHNFSSLRVVAGATRLLAAKELGWKQIEATMIAADNSFEYQLIEIEENLARHDLSETERAKMKDVKKELQAKRIAHFEELMNHPTKTDEDGKPSNRERNQPPPKSKRRIIQKDGTVKTVTVKADGKKEVTVKAKGGRGKKGGVADAARKAGVPLATAQRHLAKKAKPTQTEKRVGLAKAATKPGFITCPHCAGTGKVKAKTNAPE